MVVGLMAYSMTKSIVQDKVSDASYQTIEQASENLNTVLKGYEDITMQFLTDKDLHTMVNKLRTSTDDYGKFEAQSSITDKIQNYIVGNSSITGVYLLPTQTNLPVITSGSATVTNSEALMKGDWLKGVQDAGGKAIWLDPSVEGLALFDKPNLGVARLLRDTATNTASYVVLLIVDVDSVKEHFGNINLGKDSSLAIISNNNKFVVPQEDNQLIGTDFTVSLPTEGSKAETGAMEKTDGSGGSVLAVYQTLSTVDWKLAGTIPVKELVKDANKIRLMTWAAVIVAVIFALLIGFFVIWSIARPLTQISRKMGEGSKGDLTVRSQLRKRHDEIGLLSESFDQMMEQISTLARSATQSAAEVLLTAGELSDASRRTAISAKEISVATEEIANGASSLAAEAEKGSDLTSHINDQMRLVIEANDQMVVSASDVEKASEQGTAYMASLIEKTGLTEEMTRAMVEKVDKLKDSTRSIVKILEVLNNLTKQTNILSLNAAIEAARAGAAGKGFMVVADEIRLLAEQSRQSIDVVGQITQTIQSEIDETVHVLSDAHPLFQEQIQSVKEANQIFHSVQGNMGHFVQKLDSVTSYIATLDKSQLILTEAMGNVSAVAQQSSATSEEVASLSSEQQAVSDSLVILSQKLDSVSNELKNSLSKFRFQ
ncbi:methyl-accepting chemotaxis protein [Paenibacillus protaetiae]|uniref:Methyl-accepting chemotaxis protein n=2 Tax=Paenibacillus protaetiae TaxID=2509456 RepID=A0A4P6F2C1_9BACL|nr:methyl-accepting chemotaxis protein [Paenibacillus protaetiae]